VSDPISASADSFLGIHGTALVLREQRLQLIAANLANADTPGFKAQDLDFNTALRAATTSGATAVGADPIDAATASAQYARVPTQPSQDGNTVEGERENATFRPGLARIPRLAVVHRGARALDADRDYRSMNGRPMNCQPMSSPA
jgi:flagellar basal-body rod protein FlgB